MVERFLQRTNPSCKQNTNISAISGQLYRVCVSGQISEIGGGPAVSLQLNGDIRLLRMSPGNSYPLDLIM
jgi:hypothetical protein